jgi:hypothetical protein
MTLSRRLASAVLMSALAAGCSQSLFDANPAPDGPDARDGEDADAAVPMDCPVENCVGDAVAEFATEQNGPWRYVEVGAGELGFIEMNYEAARVPPAWVGARALAASIVNCAQQTDASSCSGLADRILLQPSSDPDEPRPALAWTARATGTYHLTIDWRLDDTQASERPAVLQVTRNSQLDHVLTAAFNASTEVSTFAQGVVEIDALQGDSIALVSTARALADDMSTPLGVRFYVSDLERNDHCQVAFELDGQGTYSNACGGDGQLVEYAAPTIADTPPDGIPGVAREFGGSSRLVYEGVPNDYSGDWTLQFWAKLDGPGEVLSDLSCTLDGTSVISGGISMEYDGDVVSIAASDEIQRTDCAEPPQKILIGRDVTFIPEDWHFYRIVRNRDGSMVTVCLDGLPYETVVVPSGATMATNRALEIGNTADGPLSSFIGQLADLRLYNRALPCILAPP